MTADRLVATTPAIAGRVVDETLEAVSLVRTARRRCAIALCGGSVASSCFPALAASGVDWSDADFFWADERAVPPDDPESNYGLANRLWFAPAAVPPARIHRMPAERADLDTAADDYAATLRAVLGPSAMLDLVLLGMGPDGHVASLFPGHASLREETRLALAVTDSPKPPPRRLTLTLPVLIAARRVIVVAFGASKADALRDALTNPSSELPVALVLRETARPLVLADKEAGRGIV